MKNINKKTLIITSAVTMLPAVFGFIMWNRLPASMTTHWGADGVADGFSGRLFAVLGMPLIILALYLAMLFFTGRSNRSNGQSPAVMNMVMWICPFISLFACGIMYASALGGTLKIGDFALLPLALLFMFIGNYLPKTRRNTTIGVKVKWTLESDANWNATHRFAGRLWFFGGLLICLCVLIPGNAKFAVMGALMLLLVAAPVIFSKRYSMKHPDAEEPDSDDRAMNISPMTRKISNAVLTVVLLGVGILMFTGNVSSELADSSLNIRASYWNDLSVDYGAISSLELREEKIPGIRTAGFGSARLSLGNFNNDEFGAYTRYTYTRSNPCIVIEANGRILVLAESTPEKTRELYEALKARVSE